MSVHLNSNDLFLRSPNNFYLKIKNKKETVNKMFESEEDSMISKQVKKSTFDRYFHLFSSLGLVFISGILFSIFMFITVYINNHIIESDIRLISIPATNSIFEACLYTTISSAVSVVVWTIISITIFCKLNKKL